MSVRVERDGAVWTVVLSRPEARNAVDPETSTALYDTFLAFEDDRAARVAVFWGEGGAFCAGWDRTRITHKSGGASLAPGFTSGFHSVGNTQGIPLPPEIHWRTHCLRDASTDL